MYIKDLGQSRIILRRELLDTAPNQYMIVAAVGGFVALLFLYSSGPN